MIKNHFELAQAIMNFRTKDGKTFDEVVIKPLEENTLWVDEFIRAILVPM